MASSHLASRLLNDLDELTPLPIDIYALVKNYGIRVEQEQLPEAVEGIYLPASGGLIILNDTLSKQRKRFVLAHELYHHLDFMLAPSKSAARFKGLRVNEVETQADNFALDLLIPQAAVLRISRTIKDHKAMAAIFDVPEAVIAKRLEGLLDH